MHTIARSHRIHIPRILTTCASSSSSSVAAASSRISVLSSLPSSSASIISLTSSSSCSSSSFNPIRSFAAAGGAAKKSKKATDTTAAEPDLLVTNEYDEYNIVPPQPKPSAEELAQSCLTEEQLRFAKRPMPSSQHRTDLLPTIYVGEKRIVEHSVEDLGKYYTVPTATLNSMPPNIHRTMSQEYMAGGPYHMIRSPGFEIVQALKKIENGGDEAKSVKKRVFGVRGESGCGKSAALHYACQFAREQTRMNPSKPWLLIGTRADEFTTETKGFIAPSPLKDGIYDQALYTMEFFKNMLKTESAALKKIKLKRWAVYDANPIAWSDGTKGETLFDLVTLASTDRAQAPRLLYEFVGELKHKTEIPVLVAIDNLNVWDQVCEFIEPYTYKKMDPRKLALVDAFNWFIERPPGNGASVWAITTKHATLNEAHRHFQRRDVLGLDSWWYSAKELRQCVVHYSVSEFILGEVNLDLLTRISGLTGKVPRDVFKQAFLR